MKIISNILPRELDTIFHRRAFFSTNTVIIGTMKHYAYLYFYTFIYYV